MGAIMSIGVATANSILLVTFASERMELGRSAAEAAVDAGCTRLRPIVMTALAMIIGMLPMALGMGERRRAERSPCASRNWWLDGRHSGNLVLRSVDVQHSSPAPGTFRGEDRMSTTDQAPASRIETPGRPGGGRRVTVGIAAFLLAALLLAVGIIPRVQRHARAADTADTASASLANVLVVRAKLTSTASDLELPGNIQSISLASIYARTNGYVQERLVDIGTPVKAGQLLALIASPEVDQELSQGRAAVEQAPSAC
jgi:hypothetical protein